VGGAAIDADGTVGTEVPVFGNYGMFTASADLILHWVRSLGNA
jgi:hypothetical protein